MKKYEYEILVYREVNDKITWFFASKPNEASGTGNLGGGSIAEVLLKRE